MNLPPGYAARPATRDDLSAVCELVIAVDVEEYGEPDFDEAELAGEWSRPDFDLARDTWLVTAPDGTFAAYGQAWEKAAGELVEAFVFCAPGGPDLYPWLVARVDERSAGLTTHVFNSEPNLRRANALTDAGYGIVRVFRRMVRPLDGPLDPPPLPDGVALRRVTPDDLGTVWSVQQQAFRGHFGSVGETYEAWYGRLVDNDGYRPEYWWLADVDGEPAGMLIGLRHEANGWVRSVGVLPHARGRGAGSALLGTAFAAFAADGCPRVGLGVDSENATGAMVVYERAGMHPDRRWDCYAKPFTGS